MIKSFFFLGGGEGWFKKLTEYHPWSSFPEDTMGSSSVQSTRPEEVENVSAVSAEPWHSSLTRINVLKLDNFMVKGNQVPPLDEKVLLSTPMSQLACLLNDKQEMVKDTHALDFFCLFPLSSLFISEFDINKYKKKSIIHNKDTNQKSCNETYIRVKKTTGRWFGAAFLRDHTRGMVLNKDGKINNQ